MSNGLVAKMKVVSVTKFEGEQEQLKLSAVSSGDGDVNKQWSKWTPCANLDMSITNPGAQGVFKPGDFVKVHLFLSSKDEP